MRRTMIVAVCAAVLATALVSCEESREENLKRRLDAFRTLLPEAARSAFDSGDDSSCVAVIESAYAADSGFAHRYDSLKSDELIDMFSHRDVVDFYRNYFVVPLDSFRR